jgi:hypothetical protein
MRRTGIKTTTMTEELMGMIIGALLIGSLAAYVALSKTPAKHR